MHQRLTNEYASCSDEKHSPTGIEDSLDSEGVNYRVPSTTHIEKVRSNPPAPLLSPIVLRAPPTSFRFPNTGVINSIILPTLRLLSRFQTLFYIGHDNFYSRLCLGSLQNDYKIGPCNDYLVR